MDWFLYDNGLRHERVKHYFILRNWFCDTVPFILNQWKKLRMPSFVLIHRHSWFHLVWFYIIWIEHTDYDILVYEWCLMVTLEEQLYHNASVNNREGIWYSPFLCFLVVNYFNSFLLSIFQLAIYFSSITIYGTYIMQVFKQAVIPFSLNSAVVTIMKETKNPPKKQHYVYGPCIK